jgi:predicted metallo-beta-lactamase superfamily hydrolase
MNKLPPRVKKPFKSTYDQLIEMGMEKAKELWKEKWREEGIDIGIEKGFQMGEENKTKKQLHFWLHVKKFSIPYIADISGRSEEEILEDIKKWNLELPAHDE